MNEERNKAIMKTYMTVSDLVDQLSDVEFEHLLRLYVERQSERFEHGFPVTLTAVRGGGRNQPLVWCLHETYGEKNVGQVKGEILSMCVTEHIRRQATQAVNKLMLIEHQAEPFEREKHSFVNSVTFVDAVEPVEPAPVQTTAQFLNDEIPF